MHEEPLHLTWWVSKIFTHKSIMSTDTLKQLEELRKENERLRKDVALSVDLLRKNKEDEKTEGNGGNDDGTGKRNKMGNALHQKCRFREDTIISPLGPTGRSTLGRKGGTAEQIRGQAPHLLLGPTLSSSVSLPGGEYKILRGNSL